MLPVLAGTACRQPTSSPRAAAIDLIRELPAAEKRPSAATFEVAVHESAGVARPSVVSAVPSRLIATLRFPPRASLDAYLAVRSRPGADPTVGVRIGVSDDRIYEGLAHVILSASASGWTPVSVDLSRYAGRKWSLFYRPDSHDWRLVLSADAKGPAPPDVVWGQPAISTDAAGLRTFAQRARE